MNIQNQFLTFCSYSFSFYSNGNHFLYDIISCVPDNKEFHTRAQEKDQPFLYCILPHSVDRPLSCPPAMKVLSTSRNGKSQRFLLRGDSEGYVTLWNVPDITIEEVKQIQDTNATKGMLGYASEANDDGTYIEFDRELRRTHFYYLHVAALNPTVCTSLSDAWALMKPPPAGILDQLNVEGEHSIKLTASIYLPQQSRLVVGREDGTIIIVPATQTVMLQLLHFNRPNVAEWPPHQILAGHRGRVNCLLCPSLAHPRYDKSHLLSGGVDFAVCLWDLYSGSLLHRFCVHAGEITQLLVPPNTCSVSYQIASLFSLV